VSHTAAAAAALLAHLVVWLPVTVAGLAALALHRAAEPVPGHAGPILEADPA
jgi:hypothetical protein